MASPAVAARDSGDQTTPPNYNEQSTETTTTATIREEEDDDDTDTRRINNNISICEECKEQTALYQCPGCNLRTGSLACCRAHKKRTKCSGKRPRGAYLPLCRMNDGTLRSDYFFMEEVLNTMPRARKISRLAEDGGLSAAASNAHGNINSNSNSNINNASNNNNNNNTQPKSMAAINKKAKRLVQQALRRGITLQIMPPVLERHKNNTSWYSGPRDVITWKVEVVFVPSRTTVSLNVSEQEEGLFDAIIANHAATTTTATTEQPLNDSKTNNNNDPPETETPTTSNPRLLSSPDHYELLIKRLPSAANNPRYTRLEKNECLRKSLEGLTIVEYPTIYCVPNEHLAEFPIGTTAVTETVAEPNRNINNTTTAASTPAEV